MRAVIAQRPAGGAGRLSTVASKSSAGTRLEHDAWTSVPPGSTSGDGERRSAGRRPAAPPAPGRGGRRTTAGRRRRRRSGGRAAPGRPSRRRRRRPRRRGGVPGTRPPALSAMLRRAVASAGALWSTLDDLGRPAGGGVDREAAGAGEHVEHPPTAGQLARPGSGCPAGRGSARSSGPARRRPRTTARPRGTAPARRGSVADQRHAVERRRVRPAMRPSRRTTRSAQLRREAGDHCANVGQPGRGVGLDDGRRRRSGR